jgi:hypothetical protein
LKTAIKKAHFMIGFINIFQEQIQRMGSPIFTNRKNFSAGIIADFF